jgi:HicA toxin of bacterial toxin-antitoxin,
VELAGKHRKTYKAVFSEPTRANIAWADIERLFEALGGELSEGRGSRLRVNLNGVVAVFHRPHPQKEANKSTVESARKFLKRAGV